MNNQSCPFCLPFINERIIYQDPYSFIILSREAINAGQVLIIPKRHIQAVNEAGREEICSMYFLAKKIADIFINTLHYDGVNILMNSGVAAGQTVNHLHIHVVPRKLGDVKIASEWLSPEFKEKEYIPDSTEVEYFAKKIMIELNKS